MTAETRLPPNNGLIDPKTYKRDRGETQQKAVSQPDLEEYRPFQSWPSMLESKPRQKKSEKGEQGELSGQSKLQYGRYCIKLSFHGGRQGRAIHQPCQPPGGPPPPSVTVLTTDDWGSGTAATIEALKTRQIAVARRVRRDVNMVLNSIGWCVSVRGV